MPLSNMSCHWVAKEDGGDLRRTGRKMMLVARLVPAARVAARMLQTWTTGVKFEDAIVVVRSRIQLSYVSGEREHDIEIATYDVLE